LYNYGNERQEGIMDKIRVDIEEIKDIVERKKRINSVELDRIEFYENGVKLEINQELVEEFIFTGLNNFDFITSEFYLYGFE